MKKTLAILLALAMMLCLLAGCGEDKEESGGSSKKGGAETVEIETGKYPAVSCFSDGEEYICDEDWLVIEEGGSGTLVFEGEEYAMDWELDGSEFTFEDEEGSTFVGTYEDGVIEGVLDENLEYVFEREGTGSKKGAAPAEEEPAEEPEEEPEAAGFEPVSGTLAGFEVTIVGAELFEDIDDKDAIRVYWDFTNTSDETVSPMSDLSVALEQEGFELTSTYDSSEDDVPEYGNSWLEVRPGVTIRCISEYSCKAAGEAIAFTIYDWYDEEDALTAEFDPANMPGRPAEDWVAETIDDPQWVADMSDGGDVGDAYVFIESAEVVPGWSDGEEVIRVYFEYTNNAEEAENMWIATSFRAFQDGIELETDWADEDVEEDDNFSLDIEPGETIRCAETWALRSDSPIEVEVYDSWTDEYIGCLFVFE